MAREYEKERIIPPHYVGVPAHTVYETFEAPKYTAPTGIGDDWEAGRSITFAKNGMYSFRLRTKASNPAADDAVKNTIFLPILHNPIYTFSSDFLVEGTPHDYQVQMSFGTSQKSKTHYWIPIVQVRVDTGEVQVVDGAMTWQTIGTLGDLTHQRWIYFEVSADISKEKYKTVTVGSYVMDASAHKILKLSGYFGFSWVNIATANVSTNRSLVYFDNVTIKGYFA